MPEEDVARARGNHTSKVDNKAEPEAFPAAHCICFISQCSQEDEESVCPNVIEISCYFVPVHIL